MHHAGLRRIYERMRPTAVVRVQAAIARRLAFLDTLAWEVRTTEGVAPALAQEQAELLWKQRGRGGGGPPPSQLWR